MLGIMLHKELPK